jgi:hypothetical protein
MGAVAEYLQFGCIQYLQTEKLGERPAQHSQELPGEKYMGRR